MSQTTRGKEALDVNTRLQLCFPSIKLEKDKFLFFNFIALKT